MIVFALVGLTTLAVLMVQANLSADSADDAEEMALDDSLEEPEMLDRPAPLTATENPITRIRIFRIGLDTRVVPSKYLNRDGGTWEIPPFRPGHAELTAGAGQVGNAVLFGHVTSITLGQVFRHLDRVQLGDEIVVGGPSDVYRYEVVDVKTVSRFDVSILADAPTATISLITCIGNWLPLENDFDRRLVVRAELRET